MNNGGIDASLGSVTLSALLQDAAFAVAVYEGPEHVATFSNPHHDDMVGGRVRLGKPLLESMPELAGQESQRILDEVYRTGMTQRARELLVQIDHGGDLRDRWFDLTWQALQPAGIVTAVVMTGMEVTAHVLARRQLEGADKLLRDSLAEQRSAQKALQESESQVRELIDNLPELAWSADPTGHIGFYNRCWYEYTGTTFEQMQGWGWQSVHDPAMVDAVVARWTGALQSGDPFEMEFPLRGADGIFRWFLTRVLPLRDGEGQIVRWIGTNTNIQALREAERRALLAAERLGILSAASAAIMDVKLDVPALLQRLVELVCPSLAESCVVVLPSPDGEKLDVTAYKHEDPETHVAMGSALTRESLEARPTVARRVAESGESVFIPVVPPDFLRERTGDVWRHFERHPVGSLISVPLRTARGVFGVLNAMRPPQAAPFTEDDHALLREMADRTALAIEAAQRYAQAQDAIQLRDEFLSIASHELKTPLTTLQIRLQGMGRSLARHGTVDAAQLATKLAQTDGDMARLARLIEDLLDVSRISAGKLTLELEDLDLAELARDAIDRHAAQAQSVGAPIELSAPEPVRGLFDRMRMDQLLSNLLTNALKYAPGRPIEVSVRAADGAAIVAFKDHGMGIRAEDIGRIFGRFERAVSSMNYGGLGLGLYIAQQVVEAHGGRIEVESRPGVGATFTATLPLAPKGS